MSEAHINAFSSPREQKNELALKAQELTMEWRRIAHQFELATFQISYKLTAHFHQNASVLEAEQTKESKIDLLKQEAASLENDLKKNFEIMNDTNDFLEQLNMQRLKLLGSCENDLNKIKEIKQQIDYFEEIFKQIWREIKKITFYLKMKRDELDICVKYYNIQDTAQRRIDLLELLRD